MNLQQLIGELQSIANAYPSETPVRLQVSSHDEAACAVSTQSDEGGVVVILKDSSNA